jgi:hypothetical protein
MAYSLVDAINTCLNIHGYALRVATRSEED